jgi:hypothetical protein
MKNQGAFSGKWGLIPKGKWGLIPISPKENKGK